MAMCFNKFLFMQSCSIHHSWLWDLHWTIDQVSFVFGVLILISVVVTLSLLPGKNIHAIHTLLLLSVDWILSFLWLHLFCVIQLFYLLLLPVDWILSFLWLHLCCVIQLFYRLLLSVDWILSFLWLHLFCVIQLFYLRHVMYYITHG